MKLLTAILATIGLAVVVVVVAGSSVSAHVLLTSQDGSKGAILHIMPDDDPIAGELATLLFDTQGGVLIKDSLVVVEITNTVTNQSQKGDAKIDGSLVTVKYTFPTQGLYSVRYTLQKDAQPVVFEQTIRVSRGVAGESVAHQQYPWAEALLFAVVILFVMLSIIAWNRRKEISKASTF